MDQEGPLGGTSKDHLVELHLQEGKGLESAQRLWAKTSLLLFWFFFLGSEGIWYLLKVVFSENWYLLKLEFTEIGVVF